MKKQIKSLQLRALSALLATAFVAHSAWAISPFSVRDIRVEGLQRVEPGTVFASIPVRVGDMYNDEAAAASIRALFSLGVFKDVRIDVQGDVVVVIVQERPTVAEVNFSGFKEVDKEALKTSLREVGLTEGRPYDKALTDRAEQEIKNQYISRGMYNADVMTTVTPVDRNRVNITFAASEGSIAKIKSIRFVGNRAISSSDLSSQIDLDSGGWLSWYTKSDRYSRTKLNADLETIKSYYLTRGFLEFKIESTQVSLAPNKQDVILTINVSEGNRYVVSGVSLAGNYLGRENEFRSLVEIKPGQAYNAEQVTKTTKAFAEYFGSFGYAFPKIEARPEIDRVNRRVMYVIEASPQRRVYVRRINIAGNSRTRDEVIRREFRQFESAWYDGDKIRASRDRVDRLGYFKDVNVDVQEVPGTPDQVDINMQVVEKPNGSVSFGVGYSSADKLGFNAGYHQENAFGSGNNLGLDINTSKFSRTYALSSTDPYFTSDGVSRTIDVYYRTQTPTTVQGGDFTFITEGASLRFGFPISETDTIYFGGGPEKFKLKLGVPVAPAVNPAAYVAYNSQHPSGISYDFPLTVGWAHDGRDSALTPNSGLYQRANFEISPALNDRYMKLGYQFQHYIPLNKRYTFAYNADFGWGKGIQNYAFPVFKNYYGGGLGSVRGFDQGSMGPQDASGNVVGGTKKIVLNAQMYVPFPGAGNDRTLRLFGFVDAGNIWGENEKVAMKDFRSSVGVGLSWISPIGPLQISFARPIRKQPQDKIQKFQFQIGTSF